MTTMPKGTLTSSCDGPSCHVRRPPPHSCSPRRRISASIVLLQWLLLSKATLGFIIDRESMLGTSWSSYDARTTPSTSLSSDVAAAIPWKTRRRRRRKIGSDLQLSLRSSGHRGLRRHHVCSSLWSSRSRHVEEVDDSSATEQHNSEEEEDQRHDDEDFPSSMVTSTTFEEQFGDSMPSWLLAKADECGFTHPTFAQAQALRSILVENKTDVVLQAETGSGKTLAYLLPCLSRIDPTRSSLQAVVVVPTRELGLQVAKVARRLASGYTVAATSSINNNNESSKSKKILVMNVLQGSRNKRQRAWAWAEPPHLVIGTPPELLDMIAKGGFKRFNSIRTLVVDEVDACLLNNMGSVVAASSSPSSSSSSGFIQMSGTTLHELLSKHLSPTFVDGGSTMLGGSGGTSTNLLGSSSNTDAVPRRPVERRRLTIFCSATIPQPRHFVKQCVQNQWMLNEPVHLRCRPTGLRLPDVDGDEGDDDDAQPSWSATMLPSTLEHQYVVCANLDQQFTTLRRLLQRIHGNSSRNSSNTTTSDRKKLLIFCDPRRPMKDMAEIIRRDLDRASSSSSASMEPSSSLSRRNRGAVVSVLSLDDSLSERADAMSAFRGDDNNVLSGRTYDELDDEENSLDSNDDDENGGTADSAQSPPPSLLPSFFHAADAPTTRILLSTDLAARGLDIVDITHVIHYDLPVNVDAYVHRSGRAGRFGRPGRVLSILPPEQEFVLQRLLNQLQISATCVGRLQQKEHQPKRRNT